MEGSRFSHAAGQFFFGGGGGGGAPTFLSLHVGVGEEPGAGRGEDGGHAELAAAGFARGDLRRRLRLASAGDGGGAKETSRETKSNRKMRISQTTAPLRNQSFLKLRNIRQKIKKM